MYPTLLDGQEVLVDPRAYRRAPPAPGDVVLARHPFRRDVRILKRLTHQTPAGRWFLQGDNPDPLESTDSRSFGALLPNALLGKVVRVL